MGMSLALHCDLRLAAPDAVIGYPEVKHGMISAVSALHLPRVMPTAQAMELLLMARNIKADEALRMGLVNAVVDDVFAEAEAWAARIAACSPAAVQATKRLATFGGRLDRGRACRSRSGARRGRGQGRLQGRRRGFRRPPLSSPWNQRSKQCR